MKGKHIPDLYYTQDGPHEAYDIYDLNRVNKYVCSVCGEKDVKMIVKAVNSYEALVKACEEAMEWVKTDYKEAKHEGKGIYAEEYCKPLVDKLQQALKTAKREEKDG
jgi:hypothetical protein